MRPDLAPRHLEVAPLAPTPDVVSALVEMLIEAVAEGALLSFLHPVDPQRAAAYWRDLFAAAERGDGVVLGARLAGRLVGSLTLLFDPEENKRHRGSLTKMIVRQDHRGRGLADALIWDAERRARARGVTLLTLGTGVEAGRAKLYERHGFQLAGIIPGYLERPHGGYTGQMLYWKALDPGSSAGGAYE